MRHITIDKGDVMQRVRSMFYHTERITLGCWIYRNRLLESPVFITWTKGSNGREQHVAMMMNSFG